MHETTQTDLRRRLLLDNPVLGIADGRELTIGGQRASELIARFGSPLVVISEDRVRERCRAYREALSAYPGARAYYASKAFLTTGFCRLIQQEGLGIDVVSAGELQTVLQAGFPPELVMLHGNAKGREELELALNSGVGRVVIDNSTDIEVLSELLAGLGRTQRVMLRVAPGVQPHTHRYVQTGQQDSKFGFNIEGGAAEQAVARIVQEPRLELIGIHCHIGSQILDLEAYEAAARIMLTFFADMKQRYAPGFAELNLGGGLGIRYRPEDAPPSIAQHVAEQAEAVLAQATKLGIEAPVLFDEPGRSIVGDAGVTLYTVQSVKEIPGVRNYASVNGGMTDNPRFALYQSYHHCLLAGRLDEPHDEEWAVSGKCCETGDMLSKEARLPAPRPGDILAMLCTGAYTYTMASHYNRVPRPAVVLVGPQGTALLARREQPEELTRLDEIPEWL